MAKGSGNCSREEVDALSTILDLAIMISATDHVSSSVDHIIGHMGLLKNATADAQAQMEKFKTMGWIGTAVGGIGVAGAAGLTHLAEKAGDVQQMMLQLGGVYNLNLDDSQLKAIEQQAQELSQQTLFSKKETIQVGVELAHAGLTQDALKKVLPQSVMLSEVEMGMGKSSGAGRTAYNFARMVDDMGISSNMKAMSDFADQLSRVVSITHASSESIGESMKYAALRARESGLEANDLVLAFGQAARSGMEGSMAGTNFTDWIERLNSEQFKISKVGGRKLTEMQSLGFIGDDSRDVFHYFDQASKTYKLKHYEDLVQIMSHAKESFLQKNNGDTQKFEAYMKDVFGEQGMRFALVASEGHNFDKLKEQMEHTKGLEEQIKAIRESFKGQTHILESNIETLGLQIGKPLMEMLTPAIKVAADALGGLIAWFDKHPALTSFITKVALGVTAFMAIGGAITVGVSAFGAITTALSVAGIGFGTIAAISGGVVLAIGAIAGASYLIYKNWDKIEPYVKTAWEGIKRTINVAWEVINDTVKIGMKALAGDWSGAWDDIKEKTSKVWNDNKEVISDWFDKMKVMIPQKIETWWNVIGDWFENKKILIQTKLDQWWSDIKNWFEDKQALITTHLNGWWTAMSQWFDSIPNKITTKLTSWKNALGQWAIEQNEENKRQYGEWWKGLSQWFDTIPSNIKNKLNQWKNSFGNWYEEMKLTIKDKLKGWEDSISTWFTSFPTKIKGFLGNWKTNISTWLREFPQTMKAALSGWWSNLFIPAEGSQAGKRVIDNIAIGVKNNKQGFIDQLGSTIVDGAVYAIEFAGIVLFATGREVIKRMITGMKSMKESLNETWDWVSDLAKQGFNIAIEKAKDWGSNLIDSFVKGIEAKLSTIPDVMKKVAQTIKDWLGVASPTKEGPLRTNHLWGANLMKSIANGMHSNLHLLTKASSDASNAIQINGTSSMTMEERYVSGSAIRPRGFTSNGVTDQNGAGNQSLVIQGPLIGEIHQQPGEDVEALAQRVANKVQRILESKGITNTLSMPGYGLGLQRGGY